MRDALRIAVVGLGKVAQDQHLPAIAHGSDFELVAAASPAGRAHGVPNFPTLEALLESAIGFDAVALCQPPQFRFHAAALAIRAGKHVLLEKPPGATSLEVEELARLAKARGTALFAAWHSRYAPGVEPARQWLAARRIREVHIDWCEDVREWHPGQAWIWEPGGFGVFDPGINALSILTYLMAEPLRVKSGSLQVPRNCCAPIGAELFLCSESQVPIRAVFDWRTAGAPIWSIRIETDAGPMHLIQGGAVLQVGEECLPLGTESEYAKVYRHFALLVQQQQSDVDLSPLRLVADAFMCCRVHPSEPFL